MGDPGVLHTEVTVRYWAAARDAAGCSTEQLVGATLADVIGAAADRHGPELARLLQICSYIVDSRPVKRLDAPHVQVSPGAHVEVLPPFAGGSPSRRSQSPARA